MNDRRMRSRHAVLVLALVAALQVRVAGASPADVAARAHEPRFREIYRELVETDTSLSTGDCTLAAQRMAARLTAAGLPNEQR